MEQKQDIEKVAALILEEMGVKDGVTPQIIAIFSQYPYKVLVRPIVKKMRRDGKSYEYIAIKLGITNRTVQWILSLD